MTTSSSDSVGECLPLSRHSGLIHDIPVEWGLSATDNLFCSPDAPQHLQCTCTSSQRCGTLFIPGGTDHNSTEHLIDVGVCECCASWIVAVMIVAVFVLVLCAFTMIYSFWCRNKWWCDGRVKPVKPMCGRIGRIVVAHPGLTLPARLFPGYLLSAFQTPPPPSPLADDVDGGESAVAVVGGGAPYPSSDTSARSNSSNRSDGNASTVMYEMGELGASNRADADEQNDSSANSNTNTHNNNNEVAFTSFNLPFPSTSSPLSEGSGRGGVS